MKNILTEIKRRNQKKCYLAENKGKMFTIFMWYDIILNRIIVNKNRSGVVE